MSRAKRLIAGGLLSGSLLLSGAGLTACSGGGAKPLQQADTITAQDWQAFAEEIVTEMISSGRLDDYRDRFDRTPVLAIGDFQNNTTNPRFSRTREQMYNFIESALINSDKALVNRDYGGSGANVDQLLAQIQELQNDPNYDPTSFESGAARIPQLILRGEINSDKIKSGRKTQYDYNLQVELLDTRERVAKWSYTIPLTKQATRGLFG